MRNPIHKRVLRELWIDRGKYLVLFLFLVISIGFASGYFVADGSMLRTYNESFDRYRIENGHFALASKPDAHFGDVISNLEKNQSIEIQKQYYKDQRVTAGKYKGDTFRIFKNRDKLNKISLHEGRLPERDDEIAIDRLYAENNKISIGDKLEVNGKEFKVSGLSAFSDYSAMFRNNSDTVFDAQNFSVVIVSDEAWNEIGDDGIVYSYAWRNNNQSLSDKKQKDKAEDIKDELLQRVLLSDIVARPDNNAIKFTGDDFGHDMVMMQWMLYIIMVVIAFIFAITARNGIEKEARTIGTLRATGYTRRELLGYYLRLPILLALAAAVVGNILGYTRLKELIAKAYYHSYSLPPYTTHWNGEAFIKTTVIPLIIILVVNVLVVSIALRTDTIQFLRGDIRNKKSSGNPVRLPNYSFVARFRTRIIFHNIGAYITLAVGILLAAVLMMFGLMLHPMLEHFRGDIQDSQIAKYQYVLKAPYEVKYGGAEKYAYSTLQNERDEEIGVYGITEDSEYFNGKLVKSSDEIDDNEIEVLASSAYMEKYRLKDGAKVKLHEKFGNKKYTFVLKRSCKYPAALTVFMPLKTYNRVFDKPADNYIGYFSDKKLTEIDKNLVATTITKRDLELTANQLESSMGKIFVMFEIFATALYLLFLYLLAKSAIEKSAGSISLVKILGYSDREIAMLYSRATGIVAITSLAISAVVAKLVINEVFYYMMLNYSGYLTYYIVPAVYVKLLATGIVGYLVISRILLRHIKRIPMAIALKQAE
ncbi:FtsX-like permease family protein [Mogibacterium timidum]|uniref:FtsX-like permease family protein n=1 Tax=Mogibacterium timidum TaxID=35519 RepID=UPI0028E62E78|nr:FtsX-like permease family protein [Mogibacterium timidum]